MITMQALKEFLERVGWRIRLVPHELIDEYNACYRLVCPDKSKIVYPPPADKLGIPLNEIWISEMLTPYLQYVLFHEVREALYRCTGLGVVEAHLRARVDEALMFCKDPVWHEYLERFPDSMVTSRCIELLCKEATRTETTAERLYTLLSECIGRTGGRRVGED